MTTMRTALATITVIVVAALAFGAPAHADTTAVPPQVVVKVDINDGHSINRVAPGLSLVVDSAVLASRGIYLVHSTSRVYASDPKKVDELARKIEEDVGVDYAEPNVITRLADTRFHSWSSGVPDPAGVDPAPYLDQPAATDLELDAAHAITRGAGQTVAVLDTGADLSHPALAGRFRPGWNYVDDTADVTDAPGHGTYVSGLVALVAPDAKIIPEQVLDSDGTGNIFVLAEAIFDATADGADVINMSLGTSEKYKSKLLTSAIKAARKKGVVVVAAAGNNGSSRPEYPAAQPEVIGVAALSRDTTTLASFSDWGDFVDVAAPGEGIVGPVPGGGYAEWAGTSAAAPLVAGQAALLLSRSSKLGEGNGLADTVRHTATALRRKLIKFGATDIVASLNDAARRR